MRFKLKNKFIREISILLLFTLIGLILSFIDFIFSNVINKSTDIILEVISADFIFIFFLSYAIYLLIRIAKDKVRQSKNKFSLFGIVSLIGGLLCFSFASLMYCAANMDFIGLSHFLAIYLSLILVLIGIVSIITGIITKIFIPNLVHNK